MNLPNRITIARIIVSIIILVMLLVPWNDFGVTFPTYNVSGNIIVDLKMLIAGFLFVLASTTDFLDGHIARSRGIHKVWRLKEVLPKNKFSECLRKAWTELIWIAGYAKYLRMQ